MVTRIENLVPVVPMAEQNSSIAVIVERRYLKHAQPAGMIGSLRRMGHSVLVVDPATHALEIGNKEWMNGIDVAIARGRSWGVLCLLDWLEREGVRSINSRSAIGAVHNKAEMAVALASAGIPAPRTWLGPIDRMAEQIPAQDYPVIIKPIFGDNCRGLEVVHAPHQLKDLDWPEAMAIAQTFFAGSAFDLKLYCIGREVWAVRKPSPLHQHGAAKAEPVALTAELRSLARRCGELFNLDLFGVDCIETEAGPLVIEVNEFPNYSAVPDADEKLSNFVLAFAKQEKAL